VAMLAKRITDAGAVFAGNKHSHLLLRAYMTCLAHATAFL
jgi:hypothetical protein